MFLLNLLFLFSSLFAEEATFSSQTRGAILRLESTQGVRYFATFLLGGDRDILGADLTVVPCPFPDGGYLTKGTFTKMQSLCALQEMPTDAFDCIYHLPPIIAPPSSMSNPLMKDVLAGDLSDFLNSFRLDFGEYVQVQISQIIAHICDIVEVSPDFCVNAEESKIHKAVCLSNYLTNAQEHPCFAEHASRFLHARSLPLLYEIFTGSVDFFRPANACYCVWKKGQTKSCFFEGALNKSSISEKFSELLEKTLRDYVTEYARSGSHESRLHLARALVWKHEASCCASIQFRMSGKAKTLMLMLLTGNKKMMSRRLDASSLMLGCTDSYSPAVLKQDSIKGLICEVLVDDLIYALDFCWTKRLEYCVLKDCKGLKKEYEECGEDMQKKQEFWQNWFGDESELDAFWKARIKKGENPNFMERYADFFASGRLCEIQGGQLQGACALLKETFPSVMSLNRAQIFAGSYHEWSRMRSDIKMTFLHACGVSPEENTVFLHTYVSEFKAAEQVKP